MQVFYKNLGCNMQVTETNYLKILDRLDGAIIFWAPWDDFSKKSKEVLYPLPIGLEFNVDEAPNIPAMLGIDDIPKIAIYEKGKLIKIVSVKEYKESYDQ